MEELGRAEQPGYSVQLVRDGCGGPVIGVMLSVEQRMPLIPGLYLTRLMESFDGADEGKLSVVGPNQVRVQIPKCIDGSGWHQKIERVYHLKPHVYF
jgi:hypothetical protein